MRGAARGTEIGAAWSFVKVKSVLSNAVATTRLFILANIECVRDDHYQTDPIRDVCPANRGVEGSPARQSVAFHLISKFVLLFRADPGRHGIKLDVNARIKRTYC